MRLFRHEVKQAYINSEIPVPSLWTRIRREMKCRAIERYLIRRGVSRVGALDIVTEIKETDDRLMVYRVSDWGRIYL